MKVTIVGVLSKCSDLLLRCDSTTNLFHIVIIIMKHLLNQVQFRVSPGYRQLWLCMPSWRAQPTCLLDGDVTQQSNMWFIFLYTV
jgi:hypothetical protein